MRPDVYRTVHADERNAIGRFHMPKKDLHGGGGGGGGGVRNIRQELDGGHGSLLNPEEAGAAGVVGERVAADQAAMKMLAR